MFEQKRAEIKKVITGLLEAMSVPFSSLEVITDERRGSDVYMIRTGEENSLIGRDGELFMAFTHLIKKIVEDEEDKSEGEEKLAEKPIYRFTIDVNDYQRANLERLKNKALILANQARDFKKEIVMDPLSPYERMIVHDALSGQNNIKTESVGFGRGRRLVIKYVEDKDSGSI